MKCLYFLFLILALTKEVPAKVIFPDCDRPATANENEILRKNVVSVEEKVRVEKETNVSVAPMQNLCSNTIKKGLGKVHKVCKKVGFDQFVVIYLDRRPGTGQCTVEIGYQCATATAKNTAP